MQDFRKLTVWRKAHHLTLEVYRVSICFPPEEKFALTSQLRRAAASIPTNIAEGCGRSRPNDKARFFDIALGSASEVDYLLILAHDLRYMSDDDFALLCPLTEKVKRMLARLTAVVRRPVADGFVGEEPEEFYERTEPNENFEDAELITDN